jgi:hypothetical protein
MMTEQLMNGRHDSGSMAVLAMVGAIQFCASLHLILFDDNCNFFGSDFSADT